METRPYENGGAPKFWEASPLMSPRNKRATPFASGPWKNENMSSSEIDSLSNRQGKIKQKETNEKTYSFHKMEGYQPWPKKKKTA